MPNACPGQVNSVQAIGMFHPATPNRQAVKELYQFCVMKKVVAINYSLAVYDGLV